MNKAYTQQCLGTDIYKPNLVLVPKNVTNDKMLDHSNEQKPCNLYWVYMYLF